MSERSEQMRTKRMRAQAMLSASSSSADSDSNPRKDEQTTTPAAPSISEASISASKTAKESISVQCFLCADRQNVDSACSTVTQEDKKIETEFGQKLSQATISQRSLLGNGQKGLLVAVLLCPLRALCYLLFPEDTKLEPMWEKISFEESEEGDNLNDIELHKFFNNSE